MPPVPPLHNPPAPQFRLRTFLWSSWTLLVVIVLLAALSAGLYYRLALQAQLGASTQDSQSTIDLIHDPLDLISQVQAAIRLYVVTGEQSQLLAYQGALASLQT